MDDIFISLIKLKLFEGGWVPIINPAIAGKTYDTIVGEKEAIAYLFEVKKEDVALLKGTYYSEGRNILESYMVVIPISATHNEINNLVDKFIKDADDAIAQSYAVRLLKGKK